MRCPVCTVGNHRTHTADHLEKYRLAAAEEKLKSAKILLDAGQLKDSVGRSYYAIFSAVRAVLPDMSYSFENENRAIRVYKTLSVRTYLADFYAKLKINYGS